jgi:hypothetical protein
MALAELPVLFRREAVRRCGIAETLWLTKRNLPTRITYALGPRREARAASCPAAPEACRSIPGNRSFKLAFGARCVVRIATVWDLNERGTGGKPPRGTQ